MKKLTLLLSLMLIALTGLKANAAFYTVGAHNGWDINNPVAMTDNGDGTYTFEFNVTSDKMEFKITNSDTPNTWDSFNAGAFAGATLVLDQEVALTKGNQSNLKFPATGDLVLTISDVTDTGCKAKVSAKGEVIVPTETYYLVGDFNDWAQRDANYKFVEGADQNTLTLTANLAAGPFKIMTETGTWYGGGYEVADGTTIELKDGDNNNLKEAGNYTITIDTQAMTATFKLNAEAEYKMYLKGSFNEWGDGEEMTLADGVYSVTKALDAGTQFKFLDSNNEWYGPVESLFEFTKDNPTYTLTDNNGNFVINTAGEYTISLDTEAKTVTVAGWADVPEPEKAFKLHYGLPDSEWTSIDFVKGEDGTWTAADVDFVANTEFGFLDQNDQWYAGKADEGEAYYMVHKDWCENIPMDTEGVVNFKIEAEGTYTFVITEGENGYTFNVTGWADVPVEPVDVFILGEVNGNAWAPNVGVKMDNEDNKLYTAVVTTAGESEGGSYFSFSTKLAETADDWDGIAPYRFGAELNGEGDFWITEELMGTTLNLGENGTTRAYRLEAGMWKLSINMDERTLVVTDASIDCDVNGDGLVDVTDMNIVIDAIIGLNNNPRADVDGNGIVDIADMNLVIDAITGI